VTTREVTALVATAAGPLSYTVANLSIGGALVTGGPPLARGEMFELELKLKGSKALIVRGRVVNVRGEGSGIAFEGIGTDASAALENLIATAEAQSALPPPLPPRSRTDELPAVGPRPDDAFFSEHDPRPPRSSSPDERAEYLRVLLKNREEVIRKARAAFSSVVSEADQLRAVAARLKTRLDALTNHAALNEVALAAARADVEKEKKARLDERSTAEDLLEQEQRRTLEAIATVSGLEATMRRNEVEAKRAFDEAEAARQEAEASASDAANVRRAYQELMQTSRRPTESQSASAKERGARQALATERAAKEAAQEAAQHLRDEVARLKAKLVNVEATLERMASRTAKSKIPAK
jgi:hypothetical protein